MADRTKKRGSRAASKAGGAGGRAQGKGPEKAARPAAKAGAAKAAGAARKGRKAAAAPRPGKPAPKRPAGKAKKPAAAPEAARARAAARKARGPASRAPSRARPSNEPDPESYFVARVRGEDAVREAPHPMTEAAMEATRGASRGAPPKAEAWDEQLGDLPWTYGDDALVVLPRDPHTLYAYWDHAAETVKRGLEGLDGGRAQLWVFGRNAGGTWERVRVVDVALESRGWYVHELEPGRAYRAEIHLVDPRQDRFLPRPSNETLLPPSGPSPIVDDRFALLRWEEHLGSWLAEWRKGGPFAEELRLQLLRLSDWSRFAGETWGGTSAGGMGGRPSSPAAAPGSPSSPWGGGR